MWEYGEVLYLRKEHKISLYLVKIEGFSLQQAVVGGLF